MKNLKYFLVFIFLIIAFNANAKEYADNCSQIECATTSNKFVQVVQSVSGVNFVSSKIMAKVVKKSIKKVVNGDIKVKLKTFSIADSKQGKFKRIVVEGKNINIDDVYISKIIAKTKCDCIHVDFEKSKVGLKSPVGVDFSAKFSANDLNKILKTVSYQKYFLTVKMDSRKLNLLEISQPEISLVGDKFQLISRVKMPLFGSFKMKIISDLKIQENKIVSENLSVIADNTILKVSNSKYFVDILNPLWFAQELLQEYDCKILLKNVKISNEMVNIDGSFFLSKSKENK